MDAVRATIAATTTASADSSTTPSPAKADDGTKSFAALFAEAKDDLKKGEKLTTVDGHEFARIKGGTRDDMCINLSGNERSGQAFDLIWRNGRQFHVYGGHGDDQVVKVGRRPAAPATGTTDTSGGTTTTPAKDATTSTQDAASTTSSAKTSS
jgi:hypothetical protein